MLQEIRLSDRSALPLSGDPGPLLMKQVRPAVATVIYNDRRFLPVFFDSRTSSIVHMWAEIRRNQLTGIYCVPIPEHLQWCQLRVATSSEQSSAYTDLASTSHTHTTHTPMHTRRRSHWSH